MILSGRESATLEDLKEAISAAWDEGYETGDLDGYANGYTAGFEDAGRSVEEKEDDK